VVVEEVLTVLVVLKTEEMVFQAQYLDQPHFMLAVVLE